MRFNKFCKFQHLKQTVSLRPVRPVLHLDADSRDKPVRLVWVTRQTGHLQNLHKYQSFSLPRALTLIQLDVVFLQVIINVLQVPATQKQHTKVDQCGIIKQMLELKVVRQTTMETQ